MNQVTKITRALYDQLFSDESRRQRIGSQYKAQLGRLMFDFDKYSKEFERLGVHSKADLTERAIESITGVKKSTFGRFKTGEAILPFDQAQVVMSLLVHTTFDGFLSTYVEELRHPFDEQVEAYLFANPDAQTFRQFYGIEAEETPIFGPNLELRSRLRPHQPPNLNGIGAESIEIRDANVSFQNFDRGICDVATVDRFKAEQSENGIKLSVVDLKPEDISDEGSKLLITVQRSDFYTVRSFLETVSKDLNLRHHQMSIYPNSHRVPHSLCYHYVLRFSDGKYLLIHRSKKVAYEPSRVSFSGEEQLKPEDLYHPLLRPYDHLVLRTLMEEVFPRLNYSVDSKEGHETRQAISYHRLLSVFLEEKFGNISMLGFVQLQFDSQKYREGYLAAIKRGARSDNEGVRYIASEEDIEEFFKTGRMSIESLVDPRRSLTVEINPLDENHYRPDVAYLHSSALYRMYQAGRLLGFLGVS